MAGVCCVGDVETTFIFQMMNRRDDLTFRKEMKFRNKLVEYLTDWIMGNSHQLNVQGDVCLVSRSAVLLIDYVAEGTV